MANKPHILLVQLFSNGDCLFATTVARQIKNDFPECFLTWIVSAKCSHILRNNPYIDQVEEVNIPSPAENEEVFETVRAVALQKKKQGHYQHVFISQVLGENFSLYDGTVCSSLYRCFGRKITVDTTPVLILSHEEKSAAGAFAAANHLSQYKNVVLFECAPQSGQLALSDDQLLQYCKQITQNESTCIILSGPRPYAFAEGAIINGNILSIRETVALTQHCSLLLGSSSGISWAATSGSAKPLPMVQLLDVKGYYFNPLSVTFKKLGRSTDALIELTDFDPPYVGALFHDIFNKGFGPARIKFNQMVHPGFRLHRGIIHNFLRKGKIRLIAAFLKVNFRENGFNIKMIKYILLGFLMFPIQYIKEITATKN